jgi:hypothetical protein
MFLIERKVPQVAIRVTNAFNDLRRRGGTKSELRPPFSHVVQAALATAHKRPIQPGRFQNPLRIR